MHNRRNAANAVQNTCRAKRTPLSSDFCALLIFSRLRDSKCFHRASNSLSLSGERVCMVMVSTLALSSGVNLSRNRPASELIYNSGGYCGRLCAKNSCRRGLRKIHDLVLFLFFAWNNLGLPGLRRGRLGRSIPRFFIVLENGG